MTTTEDLINRLSAEAKPARRLASPRFWAGCVLGVVLLYGLAAQLFLGLRPDLPMHVSRPLFLVEGLLLLALTVFSALAAIVSMYPDAYQRPRLLRLPFIVFAALVTLLMTQFFLEPDARMVLPLPGAHSLECALSIAAIAALLALLLLLILRRGASVRPLQSGAFAVFAASGIGCLTLRLAEMNDSIHHLLLWHYLPTLLFAGLGALVGRVLLRW